MNIHYAVNIAWSSEDKAYLAFVLELPGCIADGETPQQALENLDVVIGHWIEVANEEKREVPSPLSIQQIAAMQNKARRQFDEDIKKRVEAETKKAMHQLLSQIAELPTPRFILGEGLSFSDRTVCSGMVEQGHRELSHREK